MTNEEIAAAKTKVIVLFGLAVACFVADYFIPETTTTQIFIGWGLVVLGVVFVVIAGKIAKDLKTESAAK